MSKYIVTIIEDCVRDMQINTELLVSFCDFEDSEDYYKAQGEWEECWKDFNGEAVVGIFTANCEKNALTSAMEYLKTDTDEMLNIYPLLNDIKKQIVILNEGVTYDVKDKEDCIEAIFEEAERHEDLTIGEVLSIVGIEGFSVEDIAHIYAKVLRRDESEIKELSGKTNK